jgi:hypothetical protein
VGFFFLIKKRVGLSCQNINTGIFGFITNKVNEHLMWSFASLFAFNYNLCTKTQSLERERERERERVWSLRSSFHFRCFKGQF